MKNKVIFTIFIGFALLISGAAPLKAQTKVTVRFKAGTSSGTYNGSLRGNRYVDYVLKATEGQNLTVRLTRRTGETPYFNILRVADGEAIADDAREATEWTGNLPETREYIVRVYVAKAARLANRSSAYRIAFKIE